MFLGVGLVVAVVALPEKGGRHARHWYYVWDDMTYHTFFTWL